MFFADTVILMGLENVSFALVFKIHRSIHRKTVFTANGDSVNSTYLEVMYVRSHKSCSSRQKCTVLCDMLGLSLVHMFCDKSGVKERQVFL